MTVKINEAGKMALNLAETTIETAEKSVSFFEENLNTLNGDKKIEEESGEEKQGRKIPADLSLYLTRQEQKAFAKLPAKKRKQFLKTARKRKEFFYLQTETGGSNPSKRESGVSGKRGPANAAGASNRSASAERNKSDTSAASGISQRWPNENMHSGYLGTRGGVENSVKAASESGAKTAADTAGAAATAGASVGVQVAAETGKRAAESFKRALEERAAMTDQKLGDARKQIQEKKENSRENGSLKGAVTAVALTAMLPLLAAAQMAATAFFAVIGMMVTAALTVIAALLPVIAVVVIIAAILTSSGGANGAEDIVEVALTQEGNTDGSPYWEYTMGSTFVDGNATPWCASFVSWCANECGYIDDGIFPKSGAVATYKRFYSELGMYQDADGYVPKQGDLIVFGYSHIGIVQYVEDGRVITIEGNTSDMVAARSYSLDNPTIDGYCTPEYPGGQETIIPEGMGTQHTYMGWHTVTSRTSLQYQLREDSGENYDEEGFARIDGRYVVACTTMFGEVGDYVDFYRENGEVINAVIGDIKNQDDLGCNQYGHNDGRCVVEYIVSRSWYPSHANPGTSGCHPEWDSRIVKAVNLGRNYFD